MFGTHDIALFIVAGLLLNLVPGPDSLLIMARSAGQGWRAGSVASLGICTGTFVHIVGAALGVSAMLATSAMAFTVLKVVGAAYLVWVGLGMAFGAGRKPPSAEQESHGRAVPLPYRRIFVQGLMTNALNPKVALFFLAFVPQFIAPDAPSKALAFIALGCLFNVNSLLWCHVLALSTAFASRRLRVSAAAARWLNRSIGILFVSFGIRLALQDKP